MSVRPPVANVFQVDVTSTFLGTTAHNLFHVRFTGTPPSNTDFVDFDTAQGATMVRPWNHQCSDSLEVTSFTYTDLTSDTSTRTIVDKSVFGTVGGIQMSPQVACCVDFPVARRYRGGHPRMYIPGLGGESWDGEVGWDASFLTNMTNDFLAAVAGVNSYSGGAFDSMEWGSVSYVSGGAPRVTPLFDPAISVEVQTRLCSQRRRLGKTDPL